ncbi:MAG: hypothetical protein H6970_04180 [Gammaproteobacteria bacterium]|nr:hypothetical protein [Gammaproteobacteria bacterium]MCP5424247.1 hypothetical protein [Gammaproteobacteria bacterium]MCP5458879.1 hypothetical protein [Gammaproteobacteria bacterium]
MTLALGVLFLSLGILVMRIAQLACQRPAPPRWVGDSEVANYIVPVIVSFLAFGLGFFMHYLTSSEDHFNWESIVPIAINGVVFMMLWKFVGNREKQIAARQAATASVTPLHEGQATSSEDPSSPISPLAGGKGMGKRAA